MSAHVEVLLVLDKVTKSRHLSEGVLAMIYKDYVVPREMWKPLYNCVTRVAHTRCQHDTHVVGAMVEQLR